MLTDRLEKLPLAQINEKTFSHKVVRVLAWFVFPLLFFSMVDVIWEHFHRKKKLKENRTKDVYKRQAFGNEDEMPIDLEELPAFLQRCAEKEPDMYVALYADEAVPYLSLIHIYSVMPGNRYLPVVPG